LISDTIKSRLARREHPLRFGSPRFVKPESGLIFYPLNNRLGKDDPGVQAYKAKLQELCEASPSAKASVPYSLLKLQDRLSLLTKAASARDTPVCQRLRVKYGGGTQALSYVHYDDVRALFQEGLDSASDYDEASFALFVDFLNMQGVISHRHSNLLRDLVIIDPFWLLKKMTAIIRDPELHRHPEIDDVVSPDALELLYDRGGKSGHTCMLGLWYLA
jgi:hypothetical protein